MPRGRCIEHGLAIGPDGGCVLCRRERGPDSKPKSTPRPVAMERGPDAEPSSQPIGVPPSSLSPAVIRSRPPSATPPKPIVIPSLAPEADAVFVSIPPVALAFLVIVAVAGGAFVWSRMGRGVSLFPNVSAPAAASATAPVGKAEVVQPVARRLSVTMYSGSQCADCEAARKYMNEAGIAFVEWDVDQNAEARAKYEALGAGHVLPAFDVGGTVVTGFRAAGLEEALRRGEK